MPKRNIDPVNMEQEIAHREYSEGLIKVLIVDDERVVRSLMQSLIEDLGHDVDTAANGQEAMDKLSADKSGFDIVILDREMPRMDGLGVVARMKEDRDLRTIPIIMVTGSNRPEEIRQGINAGVFYYLTKPIDAEILKSVFASAQREVETQKILKKDLKKHKTSFNLIHSAIFELKTVSEAEDLSVFIANCFPEPERVITGLAELVINGVEHGNLGISYKEKTDLIKRGLWQAEADRRVILPENKHKKVRVTFCRKEAELYVKIEDEGKGFDWQRYLEVDPARAMDNHGRGIAYARAVSFDEIHYNAAGNIVTAIYRHEEKLEW